VRLSAVGIAIYIPQRSLYERTVHKNGKIMLHSKEDSLNFTLFFLENSSFYVKQMFLEKKFSCTCLAQISLFIEKFLSRRNIFRNSCFWRHFTANPIETFSGSKIDMFLCRSYRVYLIGYGLEPPFDSDCATLNRKSQ